MSSLNIVRAQAANAINLLQPYKSQITLGLYLVIAILLAYAIYVTLMPAASPFEQVLLTDYRRANELAGTQIQIMPPMKSGGEYTFQTWIFVDNYDYRAGQPKHVFTIASDGKAPSGREEHVTMIGVLYPNENKMMIRVNQAAFPSPPESTEGPDMTLTKNIKDLFQGGNTAARFKSTMDYPMCDIQNLPLQKWICLTIVVAGRVVDIYLDGKLSRSCVLPGVPVVEQGNNFLTLGMLGGWAGAVSTTRFYGYAVTPDVVYALYDEGPDRGRGLATKYGFAGFLAERLGLNIDYSGL